MPKHSGALAPITPVAPSLVLPMINVLPAKAGITQKIHYPCGCEAVGPAPMPADCPTHAKQIAASEEPLDTLVAVILDESGSMIDHKASTISAYNEYLAGMRRNAKGKIYLTLTKFDTQVPTCRVVYKNEPLATAAELTDANYTPGGGTPLYDAVGFTVRAIEPEVNGRNVIAIILTDGEENSSYEWTQDKIKKLIAEKEGAGWVFVYLGANQDAWAAGTAMGVASANAKSYNMANVSSVMQNVGHTVSAYSIMSPSMRSASSQSLFASTGVDNIETYTPSTAADLGSLGGQARTDSMTTEQLSEAARNAANARWSKTILGRNKRANKRLKTQ